MRSQVLILFLVSSLCVANRFHDKALLRTHHKHALDLNNPEHEKLVNGMVQVHLIPHSHDDVGWLKTVDEYYFGQHNNIQWAGVQYIIDSYIFSLLSDPSKKFIQVETAFFKKWWDRQSDYMKTQVKGLVVSGQLEFINGGWCMNDEATTYYEDIIDQMTLGHKFLLDTFQLKPTIGWQIDPFGHQSSQAALFSQMGFNAWFFSRIDYQDKVVRLNNQGMEMIMRPAQQSGEDNSIFSHVNYYNYAGPPGFDYSARAETEPIIDNPKSFDYNLKARSEEFVYYFRNQSIHYRGNIVMHTMGEDFQWDSSQIYFKNIDKLLTYINDRKDLYQMEIFYSTPSKYLEAVHAQAETYPTKDDDFFPYADVPNGYWTGYFTSRVAIKGITRYSGRYSQMVHKFFANYLISKTSKYVNSNKDQLLGKLTQLEEALAILQHHDAVAGTAKQHVNDDYVETITKSLDDVDVHVHAILSELAQQVHAEEVKEYKSCQWNTTAASCNITYAELRNQSVVMITVLDGKAQQIGQVDKIRVKVPKVLLRIIDQNNQPVLGDILCVDDDDINNCELYFLYTVQDPLTIQYFKLIPLNNNTDSEATTTILQPTEEELNDDYAVYVQLGKAPSFLLHYGYYPSYQESGQKSGAYIFRPQNNTDQTESYGYPEKRVSFKGVALTALFIKGSVVQSLIKLYNIDWLSQTYEIESFIESISLQGGFGKEVVMLIETQINSGNTFYTDSNGLELQKRVVNFRPTWDLQVLQPASGNYYPVNGMLVLEDATTQNVAALLNDRSQGGTSLRNGQIEIMLHRRLLEDDSRGVGEALNEMDEAGDGLTQRVLHQLCFFNRATSPNQHRKLQFYLDQPAYTYLSISQTADFPTAIKTATRSVDRIFHQQNDQTYLIKYQLIPWSTNTYLWRLQNLQEVGDFQFTIPPNFTHIETTLTGNQAWADWQITRMNWTIESGQVLPSNPSPRNDTILKPLQIRTFLLTASN